MAAENTSSTPTYSGNALGVSPALASEIGGRLKNARATSGKSTRQIADTIKVREQYLAAIEDGRWDDLPRGLNGRGIVRNYARELLVPIPELEPSEIRNHMNSQVHPFEVSSVAAVQPAQHTTSNQRYARPPQPQRTIPRRPVEVAQPASRPAQIAHHPKPNRSAFSDADDDTPLGIVTPDVARILGLPTDTPAVKPNRENEKNSNEAPRVDAKEVISELLKSDVESGMQNSSHRESKKEAKAREREKKRLAAEAQRMETEHQRNQQQRETAAQPEQTHQHTVAASAQQSPTVVVVGDSHSQRESYVTQVAAQHVSSNAAVEAQAVNAVRATPDPSIPTLLVQDHQKEVASHQNRGQQIMFVAAAAVLIAATGAYFFIRQDHRVMETEEVPQAAAPLQTEATPVASAETNIAPATTDATAPSAAVSDTSAATAATTAAAATTENATATTPAVEAQTATSPATAAVVPTTTSTTTSAIAVAPVAVAPATGSSALGAERTATLKLSGDVEMRIVIDDKVFFSGRKTAGEMPIKFKDKAEILVRDGSKVSLVYEGWDHGALGHEGRRRRIVLNAQSAD